MHGTVKETRTGLKNLKMKKSKLNENKLLKEEKRETNMEVEFYSDNSSFPIKNNSYTEFDDKNNSRMKRRSDKQTKWKRDKDLYDYDYDKDEHDWNKTEKWRADYNSGKGSYDTEDWNVGFNENASLNWTMTEQDYISAWESHSADNKTRRYFKTAVEMLVWGSQIYEDRNDSLAVCCRHEFIGKQHLTHMGSLRPPPSILNSTNVTSGLDILVCRISEPNDTKTKEIKSIAGLLDQFRNKFENETTFILNNELADDLSLMIGRTTDEENAMNNSLNFPVLFNVTSELHQLFSSKKKKNKE